MYLKIPSKPLGILLDEKVNLIFPIGLYSGLVEELKGDVQRAHPE